MTKATKRRLGIEKHIVEQIHFDLFKSTSENSYYEFGIANALASVYSMLNSIDKSNKDISIEYIINAIQHMADEGNSNISNMFNKIVKYESEE